MELLQTIFYTFIALGVLVSFHEFGHFWVARRCGVKVERFSIGFGTPLLTWRDRYDTEFILAVLPLGGYVKMVDEREGTVKPEDLQYSFNRKSVWQRMAIVSAGPIANFLLAAVAFWWVFLSGEKGLAPVVGMVEENSLAANANEPPYKLSIMTTWSPGFTRALIVVLIAAMPELNRIPASAFSSAAIFSTTYC